MTYKKFTIEISPMKGSHLALLETDPDAYLVEVNAGQFNRHVTVLKAENATSLVDIVNVVSDLLLNVIAEEEEAK